MPEFLEVCLANIGEGSMDEKFMKAMKDITANVQDLNTPAQARRTMTITIDFVPDEGRETAAVAIEVKTKLAGQKRKLSQIHFVVDRQTARHKAVTSGFRQPSLFDASDGAEVKEKLEADRTPDPTKPAA